MQTDKPDFISLRQLGLSPTAVTCYEVLYVKGPQTAGSLAKAAKKSRASVYYALALLGQKGFVERNKNEIFHQVTKFRAVRLDKALENLAIYQRRAVQNVIDYQVERSIRREASLQAPIINKDWR